MTDRLDVMKPCWYLFIACTDHPSFLFWDASGTEAAYEDQDQAQSIHSSSSCTTGRIACCGAKRTTPSSSNSGKAEASSSAGETEAAQRDPHKAHRANKEVRIYGSLRKLRLHLQCNID